MSQILVITRSLILLCLLVADVSAQENKITCTVPPVELSEDTVLTCNFPEDLSAGRKDFTIYHSVARGSPDAVVDCWWLGGKMDCFVKPGFQYNKVVTRNLTVTLSQVKHEDAGTYACQVANYGPSSMETCELRLLPRLFTTCKITLHQNSSSQASLTCFFNEDIGTLRRNFSVYKHNGQDKQRVIECQWKGERPECWVKNGFLYDYEVSTYLTLRIPEVTKEKAGNYSCWHASFDTDQLETCYLDNAATKTRDHSFKTLAIGLSVGLTVLAALVAVAVVWFLKYKGKFLCLHRQRRKEQDGEEALPMLENSETDAVTKCFQEQLVKEISAMYPNLPEPSYFVPPVYFNRTRYRPQTVAGQLVYVPDTPDPNDVRHDRAMQHVIHCLRHMAESQEERMFVLTQFQYEDYLNSPDPAYRHHRLPTPAGLREADSDVGCFDFLIVHRLHGLLVGVVKAVSDRDVESQDNELNGGHVIVQEVKVALKQLKKAKCMIQHLMSDQQNFPNIRQTLIFPNLARSSLQDAVKNHVILVENLRACLGANAVDDPTKLCLCAEQLSDRSTPWNVSHTVVSNMQACWKWTVTPAEYPTMTEEIFFGPATQSSLGAPEDYEHFSLPKTLPEAVSLTGDLFARLVLSPDLIELLDEPRVVLSGPPNLNKTTLLSLAGGNWLSSGHDVFVIKNKSSKTVSLLLPILRDLKVKHDNEPSSEVTFGSVYQYECNFESRKSIRKCIENMRKNRNRPCALVDESALDRQQATDFCDILLKQIPDSRCWTVCGNSLKSFATDHERPLTEVLSLPCVLREVAKVKMNSSTRADAHEVNIYLPHTDGPPVKHIYHKLPGINWGHSPQNCLECGREVGSFLAKSLLIAGKDKVDKETHTDEVEIQEMTNGTLGHVSTRQTPHRSLQFRDILIVFEFTESFGQPDVKHDCKFLKGLKESGIMVRTVTDKNLGEEDSDVALAVHVRHMYRCWTQKKIIVYVESASESDYADRRRRALLSCTSQLIWVHQDLA